MFEVGKYYKYKWQDSCVMLIKERVNVINEEASFRVVQYNGRNNVVEFIYSVRKFDSCEPWKLMSPEEVVEFKLLGMLHAKSLAKS